MKNEEKNLEAARHSLSHIMSMAVQELYPRVGLGVGPAIENGFYQDYDLPEAISPEIFPRLEKRMKDLIKEKIKFEQHDMDFKEAYEFYKHDPYKTEFIDDLKAAGEKKVSFYKSGWFDNLCAGPHVASTSEIDPEGFKLTKIAGAYWRGDEKNKMLQRIYGVAFASKKELDEYLKMQEEAEKRDHRKLGKEQNLFSFHDVGPGFPFFKPKGMIIWNELLDFWRQIHAQAGYDEVKTPIMLSRKLWEISGHWINYRENMYESKIDDMEFAIKPMNCPGGMLIYKEDIHSYRDLPIRAGEIGLVHRHELSGVLSGLFRVRQFHQDDAHIYMRPDQIKEEILGVLGLVEKIYSVFGLTYHLELSTRPEKSIGTDEAWETATAGLKEALDSAGREYKINEGDGAFYGPKIDIHIKDAIGRTWQCGTIQLDMNMPERFDLHYIDSDGTEKRPVMIHRVIYGSVERFFGILVEHFAGAWPVWLSPVQVKIISVGEKHADFSLKLAKELEKEGIRAECDAGDETVGNKIRKASGEKVPYAVVIGDKEMGGEKLAVRVRGIKDLKLMAKEELIGEVKEKIEKRITEKML
ncbi:MAG: threonine--tRNA ligase [Patescibacteria group bacterium]|jgi:threonyl-tRNA synthetase